jgi:UDP-glucose 4-epimerase
VDDTVSVCSSIFEQQLLVNDVINIGNDQLVTIRELAELTIRITGSSSKISYLPPLKEGDMTRRQPDNTKMRSILNRELICLEDGIKAMLRDERFLKSIQSN